MARRYARIKVTIWGDRDFRKLSAAAQRLYLLLASSPEMNLCGVTDWRPARISKLASDTTPEQIEEAGAELVRTGYIVLDEESETEEVLVRSFIRHDEGIKTPNIAAAVAKDYSAVYSDQLQGVIIWELLRLQDDEPDWKGWGAIRKLLGNPSVNPSDIKVSGKGSGNPSGNGSYIPQPSTLYPQPAAPAKNGAAEIGRAAAITGQWLKTCKTKPPSKLTGQIRTEIQTLLDEGIDPEQITAGLARWQQRGNLGPSLLPNLVHEAGNQPEPAADPDARYDWMQPGAFK